MYLTFLVGRTDNWGNNLWCVMLEINGELWERKEVPFKLRPEEKKKLKKNNERTFQKTMSIKAMR
jgi:hypothetical protein